MGQPSLATLLLLAVKPEQPALVPSIFARSVTSLLLLLHNRCDKLQLIAEGQKCSGHLDLQMRGMTRGRGNVSMGKLARCS